MNNEIRRGGCRNMGGRGMLSPKWPGIFLLIVGGLFFARAAGVALPYWIFSWPMILIGIGLFSGLREGFRFGGWIIMLLVGGIFLYDRMFGAAELKPFIWPAAIMLVGLFIVFRPRKKSSFVPDEIEDNIFRNTSIDESSGQSFADHAEILDIAAVFGGVKKKVLNKNFKGGEVVAVMGGAEVNLEQADFHGRIRLEIFNMFGGTKLIIPADWEVQSEVVAIFGGVDDKRPPATNHDRSKILFLEGTCIFGGIEIRSF